MKRKKLKEQEEEEFVPKAFQKNKKDKNIERSRGKKKKKANRKFKKFIIFIILICLVVGGILFAISAIKWRNIAEDMLVNENSVVVDTSGN